MAPSNGNRRGMQRIRGVPRLLYDWKRVIFLSVFVYYVARSIALVRFQREGVQRAEFDPKRGPLSPEFNIRTPLEPQSWNSNDKGSDLDSATRQPPSKMLDAIDKRSNDVQPGAPESTTQSTFLDDSIIHSPPSMLPDSIDKGAEWLWRLAEKLNLGLEYPKPMEQRPVDSVPEEGQWPQYRWLDRYHPEEAPAGAELLPTQRATSDRSPFANEFPPPAKSSKAIEPLLVDQAPARELLAAVEASIRHFPDTEGFPWYSRMEPIFFPAAWDNFKAFIAGGADAFPIYLDETCTFGRTWKRNREMAINVKRGPKYAQEALIPFRLRLSRWHSTDPINAKATVIVSFSRTHHQRFRLDCLHRLKTTSKAYKQESSFFLYAGDRGPCCDGGQYAQPDWLSHHVIATHGEEPSKPFVFREGKGAHQYSTNDTAPPLSCFDPVKDIGVPASATLLVGESVPPPPDLTRSCATLAAERDVLVMFAGGRSSPREYEVRKKLLKHWAEGKTVGQYPDVQLRYSMERREHNETMWRSKFCLVVEGYAPWTPRLEEAVASSCVPVVLSRRWRGPFYGLLDYSKFAIVLDDPFSRVETLRDILIQKIESGEYARLFCHLQLVKPLFRFRKDSFGSEDEDVTPMIAFEMYNKLYEPQASSGTLDSAAVRRPSVLAAVETTDAGWLRVRGAPPNGATVTYTCESEGRTCLMDVSGVEWNCTSIMEPTMDNPELDEDGDYKQCTCFRKDKVWVMPPSIRRSIPVNYWQAHDPPREHRDACPNTGNFRHREWRACPGEFTKK